MYRVMLADDEPSVTDTMKERIDWAHFNMEVTDIVQNGKDAMEVLKKDPPDLAILDIRMPGYSGLELAQYIFENKLKTRIIILSGYAEFSYAQKAMQYGGIGYCLKPVEYEEINKILHKAFVLFDEKPSKVSDDEFLEAIEGNDKTKIQAYLSDKGFEHESFHIVLSRGAKVKLPSSSFEFTVENSLYGYMSPDRFKDAEIEAALHTEGLLGLATLHESVTVSDFHTAFYKLLAMVYQTFIEEGSVLCTSYTDQRKLAQSQPIKEAATFGDTVRLCEYLEGLKEPSVKSKFNVHSAERLFNMIVNSDKYSETASDYYIHHYRQLIREYANFDEMIDKLIELVSESGESMEERPELSNNYFLKIMKYINSYYKENISLQDIAGVVNLNPNYVSQMFKKSTGTNFSQYLTNLRIDNAKKMLSGTDISISQVAADSGFNDYFYFLKTFKKHTGQTPSEYRNANLY